MTVLAGGRRRGRVGRGRKGPVMHHLMMIIMMLMRVSMGVVAVGVRGAGGGRGHGRGVVVVGGGGGEEVRSASIDIVEHHGGEVGYERFGDPSREQRTDLTTPQLHVRAEELIDPRSRLSRQRR